MTDIIFMDRGSFEMPQFLRLFSVGTNSSSQNRAAHCVRFQWPLLTFSGRWCCPTGGCRAASVRGCGGPVVSGQLPGLRVRRRLNTGGRGLPGGELAPGRGPGEGSRGESRAPGFAQTTGWGNPSGVCLLWCPRERTAAHVIPTGTALRRCNHCPEQVTVCVGGCVRTGWAGLCHWPVPVCVI